MNEEQSAQSELPRYKCHKEVGALKIAKLEPSCGNRPAEPNEETDGGAFMTPVEQEYLPFKLPATFMRKHSPQVGGYYVMYQDGYSSYSPAEAFESGYTRI